MKQRKLPAFLYEWEPVSIAWEDAAGWPGPHESKKFLKDLHPVIRHTSGYVISFNKERIVVVGTDDRGSEGCLTTDCEDVTVIPAGMIREIKRLPRE